MNKECAVLCEKIPLHTLLIQLYWPQEKLAEVIMMNCVKIYEILHPVKRRQHLRNKQLQRCQIRETPNRQHEVIDAEIHEGLHLLHHLSGSAGEGSVKRVVVGVELFHVGL